MKSPTLHSAATTATMKSSSNATNNNTEHDDNDEEDDNVSEMSLSDSQFLHNSSSDESHRRRNDKSYLFAKFLNSTSMMNFRANGARNSSLSSRQSSSDASSSSNVSLESLKQLESQMLYSDLRRESFRARAGTRNFCLNPLFEEGFPSEAKRTRLENDDEYANVCEGISLSSSCSRSSRISECSFEESRVNCVEEIFVELSKVRRCASVSSSNSVTKSEDEQHPTSFHVERYKSLKRSERFT